jgi:rod shape-determining protein MreC
MRRRTKFKITPKHILIAGIIFCVVLMGVSFRYADKMKPFKTAAGVIVTPMERGINVIGTFISNKTDVFVSLNKLLDENAELKEQVNILAYENKLLLQNKNELNRLRKLYELDQKYLDYPKVAARVISKDANNWYSIFKIDKGTRDGFAKHMNVMSGNGLVGIITEAHYNYSVVRSIIDDKSNVFGMFLDTSDDCVVKGDLKVMESGKIRVELIDKDSKISDGDEVVTANVSPNYHQGILIGYVSDIKLDSSHMTKSGYLTPAVDFDRLDEVLVITELKEPLIDKDPSKAKKE